MYEFRGYTIPDYMMGGIERYISQGIVPGQFLTAIITNDLKGAVDHADAANLASIPAYVGFFYNKAPIGCWGSQENMDNWVRYKQKELSSDNVG